MKPGGASLMGLALTLAGCITTNPPVDAGVDVVSADGVPPCEPSSCESETCVRGRCAKPCGDGGACPSGETCCNAVFCTDLSEDPDNCGACGKSCGPRVCAGGKCSNVL